MSYYLLEIGFEEIPADFINIASAYLKSEAEKKLSEANVNFKDIKADGTPRRLYLYIGGIAQKSEDRQELVQGPPARLAFDDNGALTDVAYKFAESRGLEKGSLTKNTTPKGEYLQGIKKTGGQATSDILKSLIPALISSIPFGKSMKWGSSEFKFARPIHTILSLYGGAILEFEVNNIKASNVTFGHRFLAPAQFSVSNFDDYISKLSNAFVIVNFEDRVAAIEKEIAEIENKNDIIIPIDKKLLNTVANLVEYPKAIIGSFDKSYLELPKEVLITSMKVHQKYFPVESKSGALKNEFVGIANTFSNDNSLIKQGYERVLRARLNDAIFFYNNDKLVKLSERTEQLKKVVYLEKIGTIHEKVLRFEQLAIYLAEKFAPKKVESTKIVAKLCKSDLMSEMVYEFPELQGVMGKYYAKLEGMNDDIATGIFEHYLPRFAGETLPTTDEAAFVSIADKLDSIAGLFAIGMLPTGNLDPYALRRNAIGILSIIEERNLRLDMRELVEIALNQLENKVKFDKKDTSEKIINFIVQRWKQILINRGDTTSEVFDAVADKFCDIIALSKLAQILKNARNSAEFQTIAASFKRINNILKKNSWNETDYTETLFQTREESDIADLISKQNIAELIKTEHNLLAIDELLKFAPAVNAFFDNVMVIVDDEAIRNNRLGLIAKLKSVFNSVGNLDIIIN